MNELLKLLNVPAVASHEDELRSILKVYLTSYADSLRSDGMGNLIVFKRGGQAPTKKLVIDVHMDENGVMVSGFTDGGFIRFQTVGQVDRRTLIGKRVILGEKTISGVIGMKPIHLSSRDERKNVPKTEDLYIDIGAKDKKEAQSLLELGDVGWFDVKNAPFGRNLYKGRALNSRIPCAVALKLLKQPLPVDVTMVFAAQELVGTRGAYGAAFSAQPDIVLCLDAVPAEDLSFHDQKENQLGKGVVLPISDRFTQYDRTLFEQLRSLAEGENIPWQLQAKSDITGNARAYQRSRSGCRTVGVAVPVRYLHSPVEVSALSDAECMEKLVLAFLNTLA